MSFTNYSILHKYKGKIINKGYSSVYMKSHKILFKSPAIRLLLCLLINRFHS